MQNTIHGANQRNTTAERAAIEATLTTRVSSYCDNTLHIAWVSQSGVEVPHSQQGVPPKTKHKLPAHYRVRNRGVVTGTF